MHATLHSFQHHLQPHPQDTCQQQTMEDTGLVTRWDRRQRQLCGSCGARASHRCSICGILLCRTCVIPFQGHDYCSQCGLLDAFSRRQGAVAHSTAEAEVLALNEGCRKLLFPTIALAERFFGKMGGKVLTDASAARGALENCGQNMKYITKTQRISLSWLRDALASDGITVEPVHTSVNIADACTKHLQQPRLAELCRLFGLGKPQAAVD